MRWLTRGEAELPAGFDWLSHAERTQVDAIRFTKRRQEYLTRRWTAKHAVATELGLAPDTGASGATLSAIEIRNHASGAPWVAVDGTPADLEVSLTDRAGWAVCLVGEVGSTGSLGIDLELVEPRSEGFIDDFLTEREQAAVRSEPPGRGRDAAANLMWSAKEAALKVLKVGLRADTRTVEVTLGSTVRHDGWSPLDIVGRRGDRFHGWWRCDGEFVLTVAAQVEFEPPTSMPGSSDIARARPVHSWLSKPDAHS